MAGEVVPQGAPASDAGPHDITGRVPADMELREIVHKQLCNDTRAGGALHIRANDVKKWLKGEMEEEKKKEGGHDGAGNR